MITETERDRLNQLCATGLTCAVSLGIPGLSWRDADGQWSGLDVEFGRAIAAAVCGDPSAAHFLPTEPGRRLDAVAEHAADLGVCNASWTFARDSAVLFAGVLCYDGEGFLVPRGLASSLPDLNERRVAVQAGTTTVKNLERLAAAGGPRLHPVAHSTPDAALHSYLSGECAAYVLDRTALAGIRSQLSDPDAHVLLEELISDEPMAPFVAAGDIALFRVVRHVLMLLIYGESLGEDSGTWTRMLAEADLSGRALGLESGYAARVFDAVGHYGQIYERNLGATSALGLARGRNRPSWSGGALFSPLSF